MTVPKFFVPRRSDEAMPDYTDEVTEADLSGINDDFDDDDFQAPEQMIDLKVVIVIATIVALIFLFIMIAVVICKLLMLMFGFCTTTHGMSDR